MKMEIRRLPRQSIESFASMNDLTMNVHERREKTLPKWFCYFSEVEVKRNSVLSMECGEGATIKEAIEDYCKNLSFKHVICRATDPEMRKAIFMGELTPEYHGETE